ncbi:MAG: glycosyltransferase family 4 protein [Actinomycetota bacterium]
MTRTLRIAHVTTIDLTLRVLLLAQLRRLRDEGFDVYGISAPGPWAAELESEGITHIPWLHATRSWHPKADAIALAELLRIFRRHRFDLVHLHNPKPGIMGRVAARLAGVPCVMSTCHGFYATPDDPALKRSVVLALEWIAARCSDLDLYQSAEDLAWARRIRVARGARSELLGNGTDLTRFDPSRVSTQRVTRLRAELGIPERSLVVGTVGRLVAEKGLREFCIAARKVRERVPEAEFLVVGDPDPDKSDSLSAEDLRQAARDVSFIGWREDLPDVFALMDVFVLASWREGMPRSAIEAAAMGKALVLTDIRGCREVVRDGHDGLLIPVREPDALSAAVIRLLEEPTLRAELGQAARVRALDLFDEKRVATVVANRSTALLAAKGMRPDRREDRDREVGKHDEGVPL